MGFIDILRVEYKLVYAEIMRRKSMFLAIILYPYLFTGFTLFIGYSFGSANVFIEKIGVDPVIFMITAGYIILSMLAVLDDILWKPLNDQWIGVLPYIIASPVNRLVLFTTIPLPRLTILILLASTSIMPIYTIYYGINGLLTSLLVMGLTALGSLLMVTPAMIITGLIHSIGESWRVLNIVRPLIMILIGAYYPRFYMPIMGQVLSYLLPSSHVVEVIQRIIIDIPGNYYLLLAIAFTLALIYAPGGERSIVYWERKKVREGVKIS